MFDKLLNMPLEFGVGCLSELLKEVLLPSAITKGRYEAG